MLADGTIAQFTSDIPSIKWFVNVVQKETFTASQDDIDTAWFSAYLDSDFAISLPTAKNCTVEINGTTVTITDEYETTVTLTLSDSIPLMLFVGINPTL